MVVVARRLAGHPAQHPDVEPLVVEHAAGSAARPDRSRRAASTGRVLSARLPTSRRSASVSSVLRTECAGHGSGVERDARRRSRDVVPVLWQQPVAVRGLAHGSHPATRGASSTHSRSGTPRVGDRVRPDARALEHELARRLQIVRSADRDQAGEHIVVVEERRAHVVVVGRPAEDARDRRRGPRTRGTPSRPWCRRSTGSTRNGSVPRADDLLRDVNALRARDVPVLDADAAAVQLDCRTRPRLRSRGCRARSSRSAASTAMPPSARSSPASAASSVLGMTPAPTTTRSTRQLAGRRPAGRGGRRPRASRSIRTVVPAQTRTPRCAAVPRTMRRPPGRRPARA